jgi:hypothetical protein
MTTGPTRPIRRKPPAKRLHSGLVGMPPEPDTAPAPVTGDSTPVPMMLPYKTAQEILDEREAQRKATRNEAARARTKLHAEQKKKIKEILKVPIAQVKAEAEERLKNERCFNNPNSGMSAGSTLGEGRIITNVKDIGYIADHEAGVEATTGTKDIDESDEFGNTQETTLGHRHIKPEGNASSDSDTEEMKYEETSSAVKKKFHVKLGEADPNDSAHTYDEFARKYFVALDTVLCECGTTFSKADLEAHAREHTGRFTYQEVAVCRLCKAIVKSFEEIQQHSSVMHGDLVAKLHRELVRMRKKLARDGKKKLAQIERDQCPPSNPLAAEKEGFTQTGKLVRRADGKGWVREWVRKPVTGQLVEK